jgi:MOSC domain-containing protein YiiM
VASVHPATVDELWLKPARRLPMRAVTELSLRVGHGIEGNADVGRRQVAIIARERWQQACDQIGAAVDPVLRRANVLVSGLDLAASRGRTLAIGTMRLRIGGENRPCRLMDQFHDGLQAALDADWGGGVHAKVLTNGVIRMGDPVYWAADAS